MTDRLIHEEISIKELQSMADSIKRLHASGKIGGEQRWLFMNAIIAGDSKGNLWTIGAQTGKWYKLAGDRWLEGQPPEKLLLVVSEKDFKKAERLLDELKFELDLKAFRSNSCPNCGSEFKVGDSFCARCGTSITKTQRQEPLPTQQANKCPVCGQVLMGIPNFCIKCGRKLN
jgi:hypothetical protein